MSLLEEMFFTIENLSASNVDEYFLKRGFEIQGINSGYRLFAKEIAKRKIEIFLIQELDRAFNYCKTGFNDGIIFENSQRDALMKYGFKSVEDQEVKVMRNEKFILIFTRSSEIIYNITLAKRNLELEDGPAIEIIINR